MTEETRYPVKLSAESQMTHYLNETEVRRLHADLTEIIEGIDGKIEDHHDGDDGNDFPTYLEELIDERQ